MRKLLTLIIALTFIFVPQHKVRALTPPSVAGEGALLMDMNTGQILYDKNSTVKFEPASTTKILTALIALENTNFTDKVIVGKNPPFEDGSKIYVTEGEELTIEQLLYALLLNSANDSALVLAEHIGGSKEGFAKMMNERAKAIGCKNTNFVNPHGLPEDNHYTTAQDLALIGIEAMKNPKFKEIVRTKSYQIPPTNLQVETRYLHNQNKLLTTERYKYEGADGMKTGYTSKAKSTFVGSATRDGHSVITVILKSETNYYDDVRALFDYGFNNFSYVKVLSKENIVTSINIKGKSKEVSVYPQEDIYYTSYKNKEPVIAKEVFLNKTFSNINEGDVVGHLNIKIDDKVSKEIPLIARDSYKSSMYSLSAKDNNNYTEHLKNSVKYLSLGSFFVLFIASGFYRKIRRFKKSRRYSAYKNSRLF
jgi:serine-type D-Ala-D-Ala carboxypeptidase (penicillin-binding protein 5/6)